MCSVSTLEQEVLQIDRATMIVVSTTVTGTVKTSLTRVADDHDNVET
jgi:hypothetical protein